MSLSEIHGFCCLSVYLFFAVDIKIYNIMVTITCTFAIHSGSLDCTFQENKEGFKLVEEDSVDIKLVGVAIDCRGHSGH